jgi:hypothetical protein
MKDCKTFLKLQEAARNKQAKARRQGYEGNTNNTPSSNQQANNGAAQGQNQPNPGNDNEGGYIPSKGHITSIDMGWPDLLVSDAMVMMAADDCRG